MPALSVELHADIRVERALGLDDSAQVALLVVAEQSHVLDGRRDNLVPVVHLPDEAAADRAKQGMAPEPSASDAARVEAPFAAVLDESGHGPEDLQGTLSQQRVDGKVDGEILSKDTLIASDGAFLQGEVSVGTIILSGKIVGNINASQKVHLLAPANVQGNIKTPKLIIEEGVTFNGKCEMAGEKRAAEQKVVSLTDR